MPGAQATDIFQHMRDFATSPDSVYELTFPGESNPTNFQMNVENMLSSSDMQVIGIQFNGALNPVVGMQSYGVWHSYQNVNSYTEVLNSAGETWWQDKPNHRVWIKIRGGRWAYWTSNPNESIPTNDDLLYQTTQLRIIPN